MANWRNEIRNCACGVTFAPKRQKQRYCSTRCGTRARVTHHGSRYKEPDPAALPENPSQDTRTQSMGLGDGPTMVWPERDSQVWPTPGALQGDEYQLDYYEAGYPKLPACLDQRREPEPLAEAA